MKGLVLFITGALAGAAATALLTPMSGPELRRKIRRRLIDKGIVLTERVDALVEQIALQLEEKK